MKDQYVGDVNDYLKYALLRAISDRHHALAVVWMLTPADGRADGGRLGYLRRPEHYRGIDPYLFDALAELVTTGCRSIRHVEQACLLPHAAFFSEEVPVSFARRNDYVKRAMQASENAAFVFFDPDNGIEVASVRKGRSGSTRYVYWDEVAAVYARGQSVVIYQHFPRRPRILFLKDLAADASRRVACPELLALATPHVAFVVLAQPAHRQRAHALLSTVAARAQTFGATLIAA